MYVYSVGVNILVVQQGLWIENIIDAIINVIPGPDRDDGAPLKALIFDSVYNPFRGVETYFRVFSGKIT